MADYDESATERDSWKNGGISDPEESDKNTTEHTSEEGLKPGSITRSSGRGAESGSSDRHSEDEFEDTEGDSFISDNCNRIPPNQEAIDYDVQWNRMFRNVFVSLPSRIINIDEYPSENSCSPECGCGGNQMSEPVVQSLPLKKIQTPNEIIANSSPASSHSTSADSSEGEDSSTFDGRSTLEGEDSSTFDGRSTLEGEDSSTFGGRSALEGEDSSTFGGRSALKGEDSSTFGGRSALKGEEAARSCSRL